jgi:hypothetical protein
MNAEQRRLFEETLAEDIKMVRNTQRKVLT